MLGVMVGPLPRRFLAALGMGLAAAGCMVGPNYRTPAPPPVTSLAPSGTPQQALGGAFEGPAQRFTLGADVPARWWELFHSPELDALVKAAIAGNQDLAAAQAALTQAQEQLRAQRGALLPTVAAGFNASRQRNPETLASPLANNAQIFNLYTGTVTVSYTADVFGGIRRGIEAAEAHAQAQQAQVDATYLTLTANVVTTALTAASLRDQIAAQEAAIADEEKLLAILRRQQALGQVSGADVATQEAALAQARTALPPLEKQLAQSRDLLAVLLGRYASQAPADALSLSALTLPRDIPLGVPAHLVSQRPDVRAAEANLHAASAAIGVAAAARLPSITIPASLGITSESISGLGEPANRLWSFGADFAQPIFDAGALKHQQRAAEAAYRQALAQYRAAVLLGFQNVADSLEALRQDGAALDAAALAEQAAGRSLAISRRQLETGEVSGVQLLTAEQTWRQAQVALGQARAARFADTVALYQALGAGSWAAPHSELASGPPAPDATAAARP
jgi:NodT family efflux transporter outer membrane factor (OMF) lipoprotein